MKNSILILTFLSVLFSCNGDDSEQNSDNSQEITLPDELNFTGRLIDCSDFSVHQLLNLENPNISLNIGGSGRESLNLNSTMKLFSLPDNDINVDITIYDTPVSTIYCNDVAPDEPPILISKWSPVSGTIKLSVSDIEETEFDTFYKMAILLENVVFEKADSNETRIISSLVIDSNLGFLPG